MRLRFAALLPLLLVAFQAGSAAAAVAPPRLLGLSVSNGGNPFAGDTRRLATVSPNGDGLRDRALVRFHLAKPAVVRLPAVATAARTRRVQFLAYPGAGEPGPLDPKTGAVAMTSAVPIDWRGHRNGPHTVDLGGTESWPSGLYFLRVSAPGGRSGYAPLVLRPRRLGEHRVGVVLATNTWQADNLRDTDGDGWGDTWTADRTRRTLDLRRPYLD